MKPSASTSQMTTVGATMSDKAAIEQVGDMLGIPNACRDPKCRISTGICGRIRAGKGNLDNNGYWEFPCRQCVEHYEYLEATGYKVIEVIK